MPKIVCPTCACELHYDRGGAPEEDVCPACGGPIDDFLEFLPEPQTASTGEMLAQEECHIPFFFERDGRICVRVGTEDNPHPMEDTHHIEYVALYDEDGDELDRHEFGDLDEEAVCAFEGLGETIYEVRAVCNRHGSWKGMAALEEE